jgi:HEAT repeat protein
MEVSPIRPAQPKEPSAPAAEPKVSPVVADPVIERIAALRSADAVTVRRALLSAPVGPVHVPHAILLLAWDEVAPQAIGALARVADTSAGQLIDILLSPDEEFAVRRRVPRVLEHGSSTRVIDGLLAGLEDARFEVRFRCGHALARIHARVPDVPIDAARIFAAVRKETERGKPMWENQRLLDEVEGNEDFAAQANRSLEHVFTLLSLAFPRQPLVAAFRGLQSEDRHLRGTALEYLEGVLPAEVRIALWPYLER